MSGGPWPFISLINHHATSVLFGRRLLYCILQELRYQRENPDHFGPDPQKGLQSLGHGLPLCMLECPEAKGSLGPASHEEQQSGKGLSLFWGKDVTSLHHPLACVNSELNLLMSLQCICHVPPSMFLGCLFVHTPGQPVPSKTRQSDGFGGL